MSDPAPPNTDVVTVAETEAPWIPRETPLSRRVRTPIKAGQEGVHHGFCWEQSPEQGAGPGLSSQHPSVPFSDHTEPARSGDVVLIYLSARSFDKLIHIYLAPTVCQGMSSTPDAQQ